MAQLSHVFATSYGFVTFVTLTFFLEGFSRAFGSAADLLPNGWPGQPQKVKFAQYAGYVKLPGTQKYFYYAFAEAQGNATKKPLVLWLNGGPGCSSLGAGFLAENGPWRLKNSSGTALKQNPYSWNKEANMLYVESPAGVGFSYSDDYSDYQTNDATTSVDNYLFLVGWLTKFPAYKTIPIYLSGESYAGHYIPQLAKQIIDRNKNPSNYEIKLKMKFKGVIIGNAYMDNYNDYLGYKFAVSSFFQSYTDTFVFDAYDAFATVCTFTGFSIGLKSNKKGSILYHESFQEKARERMENETKKEIKITGVPNLETGSKGKPAPPTVPYPYSIDNPTCYDYWIYKYLNNDTVQQAIHVKPGFGEWMVCSSSPLDYMEDVSSTVNILKLLIKENLQVWLYGGDADTVVPFYGTRKNIESLSIPLARNSYFPWYYYDQPSGWIGEYKGLIAATVKGAGHFVPYDKPEVALYIFKQFLANKTLPQTPFEFDPVVAFP